MWHFDPVFQEKIVPRTGGEHVNENELYAQM